MTKRFLNLVGGVVAVVTIPYLIYLLAEQIIYDLKELNTDSPVQLLWLEGVIMIALVAAVLALIHAGYLYIKGSDDSSNAVD